MLQRQKNLDDGFTVLKKENTVSEEWSSWLGHNGQGFY